MQKIITITYNTKTYQPNEVERMNSIVDDNKTYNPNLAEKIISGRFKGYLLSNQNKVLFTQGGHSLIYG